MYWKVCPTHEDNIDYYAMPAVTEQDHREALEQAQEVMESRWDALNPGESATVTITLCDAPMPEQEKESE
jgi:hypothetical protein